MGLVQIFSQISRIDTAVLETVGWNKKNKNQLQNNNDLYFLEISHGLRFVSNKDCISLFKEKLKFRGLVILFKFFREDLISRMAQCKFFAGT